LASSQSAFTIHDGRPNPIRSNDEASVRGPPSGPVQPDCVNRPDELQATSVRNAKLSLARRGPSTHERREFITLLGGAAATWPVAARAQQPVTPVIGFLSGASSDGFADEAGAFRKGLGQAGAVDGRNVSIKYRWADGHYEQMPALAADLVIRQVAIIFASGGDASAQAAKAATTTIPIVFIFGGDPVASGMVASLGRPGGNVTGVTLALSVLEQKRLELLHQMIPASSTVAVMMNPNNPRAESDKSRIQAAAEKLGLRIAVVNVRNSKEFEAALSSATQQGAGALDVASDPLFMGEHERLVALVAQHAIPAIYQDSMAVKVGGLMSYGTPLADMYRQAGIYVGQILKGAKPVDLPVLQPTKYEFHVNLKTAKALGLEVPTSLLLFADEVVE
jgi:putative tryptophan/tyrosine transport system substrate-binding protein